VETDCGSRHVKHLPHFLPYGGLLASFKQDQMNWASLEG